MFHPKYAILHKPTGCYMPVGAGYQGRGSSNWEPTEQTDPQAPRQFESVLGAKRALTSWLMGIHKPVMEYEEFWGTETSVQEGVEIIPVPSRNRQDMSIVELQFVVKNVIV